MSYAIFIVFTNLFFVWMLIDRKINEKATNEEETVDYGMIGYFYILVVGIGISIIYIVNILSK